ncbi:hypothetical protein DFP72DRAFT_1078100 [Ephemerocybe angulata]|uniref:Uncharacterized protein n=1 Tax=Ephemerocybe angulata TaxID=980116 RepID=A0A8H6LW12_9AGAR|nr:hypothetical protein DFP72DRAFT_1078100 [Tulosesus angulatus]
MSGTMTTKAERVEPSAGSSILDRLPNTGITLKVYTRPGCESTTTRSPTSSAYFATKLPVRAEEVLDDTGLRRYIPDGTFWVITSPNQRYIVWPPLGHRVVRALADRHYGYDDRSRYPQFYTSKAEYMMCIPRYCAELEPLWTRLLPSNTLHIPGVTCDSIRILNSMVLGRLRPFKERYTKGVLELLKTRQASLAALLVTHMSQCFDRLQMGMTFRSILQTYADFQRTCLEIHGYLNYVKIFLPRAETLPLKKYPVDHSVMGAFTHDLSDAQKIMQMGIPVWLVRPSCDILPDTTVHADANVKMMLKNAAHHDPTITPPYPETPFPFPVLYRGAPGNGHAVGAPEDWMSGVWTRAGVGDWRFPTRRRQRFWSPLPSIAQLMPYVVYQLPSGPGTSGSSNLLPSQGATVVFDLAWIPAWSEAVGALPAQIEAKKELRRGSLFPPPHILINSSNIKLYLAAWLAVRPAYIAEILERLEGSPVAPNTQQWRHYLDKLRCHLSANDPTSSGEPSAKRPRVEQKGKQGKKKKEKGKNVKPGSRADKGRQEHEFFASLPLRTERVNHVAWLDKEIRLNTLEDVEREVTQEVRNEVVWELHELNFRLELLLLDQALSPEEWKHPAGSEVRMQREQVLRRVFPVIEGQHSGFFVTAIPNVDGGPGISGLAGACSTCSGAAYSGAELAQLSLINRQRLPRDGGEDNEGC